MSKKKDIVFRFPYREDTRQLLSPDDYYQSFKDVIINMQKNEEMSSQKNFNRKKYIRFFIDIDVLSPYLYAPLNSVLRDVAQHYSPFKLSSSHCMLLKSYDKGICQFLTDDQLNSKISTLVKSGILYEDFYFHIVPKVLFMKSKAYNKFKVDFYGCVYKLMTFDVEILDQYQESFVDSVSTQIDLDSNI